MINEQFFLQTTEDDGLALSFVGKIQNFVTCIILHPYFCKLNITSPIQNDSAFFLISVLSIFFLKVEHCEC